MKTVSISDAKTHLSRLAQEASQGEPFIITRHGTPLAMVVPLSAPATKPQRRLGFLMDAFRAERDQVESPDRVNPLYHEQVTSKMRSRVIASCSKVPDGFDALGQAEIIALFEGDDCAQPPSG
ncbi:MAG: type II toxin-antitoxin system prevent-host-death family antitoxin [Azospirillaceae bacterium]|nr:type II toxin-antitoxin system prevent-host-death family antitoxin [Azospirillaceae bacterium]